MAKRRPYIGTSEAQSNAEALARRAAPYATASEMSFEVSWDWRKREPRDLREAVRMARKAYSDEVPTKLHEGYDSIGEGGVPKMTARAEGYLFGRADADDAGRDAETGQRDLLGHYFAPFRAHLAQMERGDESSRKRAAIVSHVTIGSQGPREAAIAEGVPSWCARVVAEDAIRAFLHGLSDIRVHVGEGKHMDEAITAA
jgi:hypothetical protein